MTGEVTAHAKNNLATWMLEHPLEEGEGTADSASSTAPRRESGARETHGEGRRWLRPYRGDSYTRMYF